MIEGKNISITLTKQEYNVFRALCDEFLGTYKIKLSRNRALTLNRILDKLEKGEKK